MTVHKKTDKTRAIKQSLTRSVDSTVISQEARFSRTLLYGSLMTHKVMEQLSDKSIENLLEWQRKNIAI